MSEGFEARDPRTGALLPGTFCDATPAGLDAACRAAGEAAPAVAKVPPDRRAAFLRGIGEALVGLGDELLQRAEAETGLPQARLQAERGRTVAQLGLFADLVAEGSWVDARIDRAQPQRTPLPRPDLRRMLVPLGPVAVFGASNFPLAFSVAGGDTASALAAGCPVVAKAHPAHPGTSGLAARAIAAAALAHGMPAGTFALLQGRAERVGAELVRHPAIAAVGFTGSLRGGRALFDLCCGRERPIPMFGEMGSVNPVFVLPGALAERGPALAAALAGSATLAMGQFCTSPGLVVLREGAGADAFVAALCDGLAAVPPGCAVHAGIAATFRAEVEAVRTLPGVSVLTGKTATGAAMAPVLLAVTPQAFLGQPRLRQEIYGPCVLLVRCADDEGLRSVAAALDGHLTATLHGTGQDLQAHQDLFGLLAARVGRILCQGVPTGVEVCHAMQHGGPYPASTDPRVTSVGSAAILRWCRPLCFQDVPAALLPAELRDGNPRGIRRLVDGVWGRD